MGVARKGYDSPMPVEIREWRAPAPLRALLWWPAAAFVLVVIVPGAATESIALAGAVLATLGAVIPALVRRLCASRPPAPAASVLLERDQPDVTRVRQAA